MRLQGQKGVVKGEGRTVIPMTVRPNSSNPLNRCFEADRPARLKLADFTYVLTCSASPGGLHNGWLLRPIVALPFRR